ncbi:outer dynein arm-docking complex subunit 4-like [Parasteatoda tepidariorum]|uniref:outer dynein arm-docking complex subunit 4-like n=1 Tax=Parasteatoda tepidariorum TaxID=114398 RepID=UPI001C71B29D|nr:uncharacterized protein LOC107449809 [Parasteatoda tepidariorum]
MDIEDDEDTEKKPKKLPTSLYLTSGNYYLHLSNYEEAIKSFNSVLEDEEYNTKALLGTSVSYLRQGKLKESKKAIDKILKVAPNNSDAIGLKGEIKYLQGDFEAGLIELWPAAASRPIRLDLRLGYQVCENAIDKFLYPGGSLSLDHQDVEEVEKLLQGGEMKYGVPFRKKRRDLHSFEDDLNFSSELMKIKAIEEVHPICKDLLLFLEDRKKFWRIANPHRDRMPLKPKIPEWVKDAHFEKHDPIVVYDIAKVKCLDSHDALKQGSVDSSLKFSLEALAILGCIKKYAYDMAETSKLKLILLHLIGLAHMFKNDYRSALVYFQREITLALYKNMPDFRLKAILCMGEIFFRQKKYDRAISCYEHCLFVSDSAEFDTNMFYKIAECHMNLNDLQKAYNYAQRAVEAAASKKETRLQLDATLLKAEISVKDKKMDRAGFLYSEALSMARRNDDSRIIDIESLTVMFHQEFKDKAEERENL